ncbi:MAG: aminotransferase class V-fold PLP-dependent enzyme [Saprospiraceae bacterium]|jgi:selenocysteine lyase/cysteine desulfurase|nr:aminotransferase class V-fold PLP-dependent enzyme [Saprospiraceae bacterium]
MNKLSTLSASTTLESYFKKYRNNVVGIDSYFDSPSGKLQLLYSDWTASGRLYRPIEDRLLHEIGPLVANTHTETNYSGSMMTIAYHKALKIIKNHVNAAQGDVIISEGSGMTGVINKLQRILGLRIHEKFQDRIMLSPEERPVIFCTHMEHHSNQTSWLETICDLEIINADVTGQVNLDHLKELLSKYQERPLKIAAITSCSNVTGIITPYHEIASLMHQNGGLCFVDFACSAPYIDIDMHPTDELQALDAIYFSPHKFLGGPGTTGILIFNSKLYKNRIPDNPGGGTVDWTNPWGGHKYVDDIEAREDGGTPAFLQTIKAAMCVKLKEEMGVKNMLEREHEMLEIIWEKFEQVQNLHVLANNVKDRLGVISFYIEGLHYNLGVKLLNDKFGIQVRGGCSCAGTYGHFLLDVDENYSRIITDQISVGDLTNKPGWIRMSIHPVMTNEEVEFIADAICELAQNHQEWAKDYVYQANCNDFKHKDFTETNFKIVDHWFNDKWQ